MKPVKLRVETLAALVELDAIGSVDELLEARGYMSAAQRRELDDCGPPARALPPARLGRLTPAAECE